jgi:hypothetical protein
MGMTGLSAFQVAQFEGFAGTEAEWLESLRAAAIKFSQIIGDGSALEFTVTHNLNSEEVIVSAF